MNPCLVPSTRKMMGFVYKRRRPIKNSVALMTDHTTVNVTTCMPTLERESLAKQEIGNDEVGDPSLNPLAKETSMHASPSSVDVIEVKADRVATKDRCVSTSMAALGSIRSEPTTLAEGSMCDHVAEGDVDEPCKVCAVTDCVAKMLICDSCERAFHLSCCYPKIKKIPSGSWQCGHCKIKKRKALTMLTVEDSDTLRGSDLVGNDVIAFMLKDTEPYTTQVGMGKDFQAEVPEWIGPVKNEPNNPFHGTPLTLGKEHKPKQWNNDKSIGNWLQCQNDISDETASGCQKKQSAICGKWRRAPLFEVQTSEWECFSAVLWDPSHADCAVPQELSTTKVLQHLKFIEALKSQFASKWAK